MNYSFFKNVGFSIITQFLASTSTFVLSIFVVRILGLVEFGQYTLINSSILTFSVIGGGSIGILITKFIASSKETHTYFVSLSILLAATLFILASIFFILFWDIISIFFVDVGFEKNQVFLIPLISFFLVLESISLGIFSGNKNYQGITQYTLLKSIFYLGVVSFHLYFFSVKTLMVALLIVYSICQILLYYKLKQHYRGFLDNVIMELRMLNMPSQLQIKSYFDFFIPALFGSLLGIPLLYLLNLIILSNDNGQVLLGVYAIGAQIRNLIMYFSRKLSEVSVPYFASIEAPSDQSFTAVNKVSISFGSILCFFVIISLEFISRYIYDVDLEIFLPFSYVLIFALIPNIFGSGMGGYIQGKGLMWFGLITNFCWGIVLIGTAYFSYRELNLLGLSISFFIANLTSLVITIIRLKELVSKKYVINLVLNLLLFLSLILIPLLGYFDIYPLLSSVTFALLGVIILKLNFFNFGYHKNILDIFNAIRRSRRQLKG